MSAAINSEYPISTAPKNGQPITLRMVDSFGNDRSFIVRGCYYKDGRWLSRANKPLVATPVAWRRQ